MRDAFTFVGWEQVFLYILFLRLECEIVCFSLFIYFVTVCLILLLPCMSKISFFSCEWTVCDTIASLSVTGYTQG